MKVLWVTVNTTGLEPTVANVIQMSVALQVEGDVVKRLTWDLFPVFHKVDQVFSGKSHDDFLRAYHGWLPNIDPRYTLEKCDAGDLTYFYNEDTMRYLRMKPTDLLKDRSDPTKALSELQNVLASFGGKKWLIAGHNVAFVSETLLGWTLRADKLIYADLKKLVQFDKSIDTVPFFKVVAAFKPEIAQHGFGLKELASALGSKPATMDTESKLDGLLSVCGTVISGGTPHGRAQAANHHPLPS